MPKTLIEKVTSPNPDVSIFKISGTLGFHENKVLSRFFLECSKKSIGRLILDFSALSSLGGGCAKIIRQMVIDGQMTICVAGASGTVEAFLQKKIRFTAIAELIEHVLGRITITNTSTLDEILAADRTARDIARSQLSNLQTV